MTTGFLMACFLGFLIGVPTGIFLGWFFGNRGYKSVI